MGTEHTDLLIEERKSFSKQECKVNLYQICFHVTPDFQVVSRGGSSILLSNTTLSGMVFLKSFDI